MDRIVFKNLSILIKVLEMNGLELDAEQIVGSLANYGDLAGSEALTRALVAERNGERDKALFWVGIYEKLTAKEAKSKTI